ncbi:MAG: ATP-binding cassette domain-containing protein [Phycisphaeraceae bacterium]|nr:ATP-binding cassette domain-containing protein [Phycisphaeraceae bacterium]
MRTLSKRISLNGRAPTGKLLRACCRFGIGVTRASAPARDYGDLDTLLALAPGDIALITGPSGCGKSTLLRALFRALRGRNAKFRDLSSARKCERVNKAVIDLIPLPLEKSLRLLAAAGLADPFVLGRTVRELSVGERMRFMLARSLAECADAEWLLLDEFLTMLDRETAVAVASSLRRAAREIAPELRIVVATPHEDVAGALGVKTASPLRHRCAMTPPPLAKGEDSLEANTGRAAREIAPELRIVVATPHEDVAGALGVKTANPLRHRCAMTPPPFGKGEDSLEATLECVVSRPSACAFQT